MRASRVLLALVYIAMFTMILPVGILVYQYLKFEKFEKHYSLQLNKESTRQTYHNSHSLPLDMEAHHYYEYHLDSIEQEIFFVKLPSKVRDKDAEGFHFPRKMNDKTYSMTKLRSDVLVPVDPSKLNAIVHFEFYLLLTYILVILYLLNLVRKLLINLSSGKIFMKDNLSIINNLTRWSILLFIVRHIIDTAIYFFLIPKETPVPFSLKVGDSSTWLFIILLVIINYAFKEGISLKEEQSLTI